MRRKQAYEEGKGRAALLLLLLVRHRAGKKPPFSPGIRTMSRKTIRSRPMGLAVLLLMCLAFSPGTAADDYLFLFPVEQGEANSGCALPPESEISGEFERDGPACHHICSCMLCAMVIGKANTACILAFRAAEEVSPLSIVPVLFSCYSEIFHPPRA